MRILLVEDDDAIAKSLSRGLREEGFVVDVCTRGAEAERQAIEVGYDIIVLDWMLPDVDGLSVLRTLRARGMRTPVLMLTARNTVSERVHGLRSGADDYLGKPFAFDELLARIDALARRSRGQLDTMVCGPLTLDGGRRTLRTEAQELSLTPREFALALELFRHRGEVLSRYQLLSRAWGSDFDGDPNVLDVYVGYLRKKLERLVASAVVIKAVRGVGFRLVAASEDT
jgi:two-component system OmpR family response regulator